MELEEKPAVPTQTVYRIQRFISLFSSFLFFFQTRLYVQRPNDVPLLFRIIGLIYSHYWVSKLQTNNS